MTTNSDWISFIAMAEFAALVVLVVGLIGFWLFRRSRRDTAAAVELVAKVKQGEQTRRGELQKILTDTLGLSGPALNEKAQQLLAVERRFYEEFIRTYLTRDSEGVQQMDERLRAVIAPYLALSKEQTTAPAPAAGDATAETTPESSDAGGGDADIARLKAAIRNQQDELALYRETLNRVFSEYTAMFGVHLDPKQQLTAKEILDRLTTGELGGSEPAATEPPAT